MHNVQYTLITLINNKLDDDSKHLLQNDIFVIENLWDLPHSNDYFTFIDFINGFIFLLLSKFLISLSFNCKDRHLILFELYNSIYNEFIDKL